MQKKLLLEFDNPYLINANNLSDSYIGGNSNMFVTYSGIQPSVFIRDRLKQGKQSGVKSVDNVFTNVKVVY